jgi:hypothetical protein
MRVKKSFRSSAHIAFDQNESSRKRKVSKDALSASWPVCGLGPSGVLDLIY